MQGGSGVLQFGRWFARSLPAAVYLTPHKSNIRAEGESNFTIFNFPIYVKAVQGKFPINSAETTEMNFL